MLPPALKLPSHWLLAAAIALPWLLSASVVPDAVLYNQLAALAAWSLWLLMAGGRPRLARAWPALAALGLCAALAAISGEGLQGGAVSLLLVATAVLAAATGSASAAAVHPVATALWFAGLASAVIAAIQYAAPQAVDGWLVAASTSAGRASGNLRQPNHLATALLCGMVMTVWLWQDGRIGRALGAASLAMMVLGVALSASRTGALSLGVLLLWAAADRSLPLQARWALTFTPVLYLLIWLALAGHAALDQAHFYGAERLQADGDISSSRFAIWRNALTLISLHPWVGVGWGNFNFAWTFTAFPDRPVAFFDHTHNALLQLAVEIGLPATLVVLGLIGWALARGGWHAGAPNAQHPARAALAMLAVLGMHSLLEYPLWYAYFLLPAAWALGVCIGAAGARESAGPDAPLRPSLASRAASSILRLFGLLMIAGAAYAAWDHRRIEAIFAPPSGAGPLQARIAEGRKSWLFGHHADYAAVTAEPRDEDLKTFRRPLHQLIDVRLLVAYIEALRANGRDREALYAAQRLREFSRPDAQAYFSGCTPDSAAPPFQCERRTVTLSWRDLAP